MNQDPGGHPDATPPGDAGAGDQPERHPEPVISAVLRRFSSPDTETPGRREHWEPRELTGSTPFDEEEGERAPVIRPDVRARLHAVSQRSAASYNKEHGGYEHLCWRADGRLIRAQRGPEPADTDPIIGMLDTPELAQRAAGDHNRQRA